MELFLVSTDETAVLEQIALGETVHSQRAQALLRLAESVSFTQAATQSGLTENQVKYWVGRFRTQRLTIFPDDLVTAVFKGVTSTTDLGGEIVAEEHGVVEQEIKLEGVEVIEEPADVDKGKKKKKSKGKKKKDKNKIDMKKTGKKDQKKKKEGKQKSAKQKDDKKKKSDSKQKIDKKKKKHSEKKKSKKKKKLDSAKKSNKGKSKKSKKKGKKNK